MAYELDGRKNICIFGNVIALEIIVRKETPRSKGLLKVTNT